MWKFALCGFLLFVHFFSPRVQKAQQTKTKTPLAHRYRPPLTAGFFLPFLFGVFFGVVAGVAPVTGVVEGGEAGIGGARSPCPSSRSSSSSNRFWFEPPSSSSLVVVARGGRDDGDDCEPFRGVWGRLGLVPAAAAAATAGDGFEGDGEGEVEASRD